MTAATPFNPKALLGDMGGTHCRLALTDGTTLSNLCVYETKNWPSLEALITHYLAEQNSPKGLPFYLSFGIKHGTDGWYALDTAYKEAPWRFHPQHVCAAAHLLHMEVVHDFKAMGLALFSTCPVFKPLRTVAKLVEDARLSLIIGPGSGVGHALVDVALRQVYDTHGAHMPPVMASETQWRIAQHMLHTRGGTRGLIVEDIIGGVALFRFYEACCAVLGHPQTCTNLEALLPAHAAGDTGVKTAISAWCNWLGLYANMLATSAYAYAGLYLCGGVTEKLLAAKAFDEAAFFEGFHQNMVAIVDADLRATPVYIPATEHTALYGLMELLHA